MAGSTTIDSAVKTGKVNGYCDPKFARVAEEFERNFQERGEVGASVCVKIEGETVVDLWGGIANVETGMPWEKDTLMLGWSTTKGATALCAHILASRGLLDLDAPVAKYWPEFAQAGKENILVRMLLNHQAGLPVFRQPVPPGGFYNWALMVKMLEEQAPSWKPGLMHGYHGITFGWLVGEVVRRVSGKSLGTFFREEVAEPLGLDYWIGLPEELEARTGQVIFQDPPDPNGPIAPYMVMMMTDPTSDQFLQLFNTGGYMPGPDGSAGVNTREGHAAELPALGGITNARGLAGLYTPLANGGSYNGVTLVDKNSLYRMSAVSAAGINAIILVPTRWSLGYVKTMDNRHEPGCSPEDSLIISEDAFGHSGFGGSMAFADPPEKLSFGYLMNKMGPGVGLNARGQSLIDAAYLSLGYSSNASGAWAR
jgi:CubicO group peptidase (beta-lactamase class C family)